MELPDKLIIALARYYHIRGQHAPRLESGSVSSREYAKYIVVFPKTVWDKATEIANISKVAKQYGWDWESCAGTFWFTKPRKGRKAITIEIDENKLFEKDHRAD